MLYSLSYYVLYAADGNRAVLASSGFEAAREQQPFQPITKPENLLVLNTSQTGMMQSSVDAVADAMAYLHQYSTDPDLKEESWQSIAATTRKCLLKGLKPGTVYYVRVAVVGRKNQKLYSDVVWRMAA